MSGRLAPVNPYNLNAGNSLIANALHDLNTVDSKNADIDAIPGDDRDAPSGNTLDQDQDSNSTDCVPQSFSNPLQLQGVETEVDHSLPFESEPPRPPYGVLSVSDVLPIETARSRFLDLILDNFIAAKVVPVVESPDSNYSGPNNSKDKQRKRKPREVQYEGDPKFVLPLAYIANLYETLISEINLRLTSVEGIHEKTMGVALEAAGGLYRRLVKKFPKTGQSFSFKRREMASAMEARNMFPHMVTGDEKRVRFVVVHGLELVERASLSPNDAEWFKRLTGRHEAAITERDYKFFSPRHKYRRAPQHALPFTSMDGSGLTVSPALRPALPQYTNEAASMQNRSPTHQVQRHSYQIQSHAQPPPQHHAMHPQQQLTHPSHTSHAMHLNDASHIHHLSPTTQHISRGLHSSSAVHAGGRLVLVAPDSQLLPQSPSSNLVWKGLQEARQNLPLLAKFCDECGTPYPRETSKYCSECGMKRVYIGGI